jgi:pimeloyl-ACP methyl ester carboxylesterase
VRAIESLRLDPNVVGRIVHIRTRWAEFPSEGGIYFINERFNAYDVKYFLGVPPNYDRRRAWPLVIKLPGAAPFLTDPPPGADDVTNIYHDWISDELKRHPEALVLMPLLNLRELYGPSYLGMNTVIQPMLHAADRVNVDPARVYLVGHSMGAHATWNLALHYPTFFAAINPLAGSASSDWQRVRLMCLRNTLPVVWHDATDDVIKVDASRSLVKILRQMKLDVDYEETKDVGHAPTDEIAERLYGKMRNRTRDLYPQEVSLQSNRPDTMFNRVDWLQVYQPLRPGAERRLLFRRGTGHMIGYQNTFKVDAAITTPNHIECATENVETMRLYVNDRMIDFAKPVTVIVNKKTRFEGMVKPSVEEMLKDQVFLGRGWRYFTGVIDIDLTESSSTKPST